MAKSVLERMREQISSGGGEGGGDFLFFKKDGEKHTVRFTLEVEDTPGLKMWEPRTFGDGNRFVCPTNFGESVGDTAKYKSSMWYFFPVYDYESSKMMILPIKASSKSLLGAIVDQAEDDDNEGITDRDYIIKRIGTGLQTSYSLNPRSPKAMPVAVIEAGKSLTPEAIKTSCKNFFKAPAPEEASRWEAVADEDEEETPKSRKKSKPAKEDLPFDLDEEVEDTPKNRKALKRAKDLEMYEEDDE